MVDVTRPPTEAIRVTGNTAWGVSIMKWTIVIAVVVGFVLAMAMAFGGRITHGPHVVAPQVQKGP